MWPNNFRLVQFSQEFSGIFRFHLIQCLRKYILEEIDMLKYAIEIYYF